MQKSKTFTHCILVDSSTDMRWTSPFVILGVPGLFCRFHSNFDGKSCQHNTVDPDQTPHIMWHLICVCTVCLNNVASDQGLQCLLTPFYGFPGKNGLIVLGMFKIR